MGTARREMVGRTMRLAGQTHCTRCSQSTRCAHGLSPASEASALGLLCRTASGCRTTCSRSPGALCIHQSLVVRPPVVRFPRDFSSTVPTRFALSRLAGNVDIKLELLARLQVFAQLIPAPDVGNFNVESIGNEGKRVTLSYGIAQSM